MKRMARFEVVFMVIFHLFTFSNACFSAVEPENGVTPGETITNLPESDPRTTTTFSLPSKRPGFEPSAKIADFKHDDASETDSDMVSTTLTRISFRPVNRHFPWRPLVPFHKRVRALNPRFQQKRYLAYGDDMILSDERTRFDPESRGFVRQIQARSARFPDGGAESKEHVEFMKPPHHDHEHDHEYDLDQDDGQHHHYHCRHRQREEVKRDKEEEHEHVGGLMKRLS